MPKIIGTLSEKGIHAYLKDLIAGKECQEIPVGDFIADVKVDNKIYEVQTGGTKPLIPKLKYYVKMGYDVTVILPIIHKRTTIYNNKGAIHTRRLGYLGTYYDKFKELYWLSSFIKNKSIKVELVLVDVTFSKIKFPNGKYKKETQTVDAIYDRMYLDYNYFIDKLSNTFTSKEFITLSSSNSRYIYSGLKQLEALGLIKKLSNKKGRQNQYEKVKANY